MFRKLSAVFLIAAMLFVIGCTAHTHKIGNGAQGSDIMEARQWYVLWGLIPINEVDTNAMAGEATDYEITTQYTALDAVISIVLSEISIQCRTVTVEK